jgi:hypothetical protein
LKPVRQCSSHNPTRKKSIGVKSDDLGGQAGGPPLPIHLPAVSLQVILNMVAEMWRRMRISQVWKNWRVFLTDDINRIRVWQLVSEIQFFLFWIPFILTPGTDSFMPIRRVLCGQIMIAPGRWGAVVLLLHYWWWLRAGNAVRTEDMYSQTVGVQLLVAVITR